MTRKDYVLLAAALKADAAHLGNGDFKDYASASRWQQGAYDQWNTTVLAVSDVLARDNPRFDRARFLKAAGAQS